MHDRIAANNLMAFMIRDFFYLASSNSEASKTIRPKPVRQKPTTQNTKESCRIVLSRFTGASFQKRLSKKRLRSFASFDAFRNRFTPLAIANSAKSTLTSSDLLAITKTQIQRCRLAHSP